MATFVLVHGAFHGAWCWIKLVPELEARGHRAVAFDLPGGGDDPTPIEQVTLDGYVSRVADVVARQPEPVILVGHSLGGMTITAAAERMPERIRKLVYLCAFILRDGESLFTLIDPSAPKDSVPPKGSSWDIVFSPVPTEAAPKMFYNGCLEADVAYALARLRPQANAPRLTMVRLTPERFGRVPRAYIETTNDQAVSLETQRRMVANSPCAPIRSLPTGHSPFFSAPAALADALADLARA
jgi:pimeloyl-ACP methyl ester carboxylesterase